MNILMYIVYDLKGLTIKHEVENIIIIIFRSHVFGENNLMIDVMHAMIKCESQDWYIFVCSLLLSPNYLVETIKCEIIVNIVIYNLFFNLHFYVVGRFGRK